MRACVIGVKDRFSIVSIDLSFARFQQRDKDIDNVMIGVEFDLL
jgi:hypothetical protein